MLLCTATWTENVPGWLQSSGHGWLTAEYSMLPGSTRNRKTREIRAGRPDGRGIEIQRLIGRSLRAAVDINALPEVSIWIDCDVLSADGGTRTLAITGGYLALHDVLRALERKGRCRSWPLKTQIAACSVGLVRDEPLLDLDYSEDSGADVDMNVVVTGEGEFAEVQASGEGRNMRRDELDKLLDLAEKGGRDLLAIQQAALES
jgi:ribonuclease PH